jgi:hypothetical protein
MEGEGAGGRSWRPGRVLGPAVLSCGMLGACGGSAPSSPATPSPTGTPPEPAGLGFLHVLQGSSVVTHAIDAASGRLRPSVTLDLGDAHTLTGEPRGRWVFAAFGPRGGPPYFDPSIVAYAPDPLSGRLTKVSEASSDPIWCRGCATWGRSGGWYWLSASSSRLYGMWYTGTYHDTYHTYVTHAVDGEGRLGPEYQWDFDEWDPGAVALDVDAAVFYKGTYTGGLTAHVAEPDGRLTRRGASHLCLASTTSDALPLAAVRGFVFARSYVDDRNTVCSWEGPRLAPRADLGLDSGYAVAIALTGDGSSSAAGRPATLVAMRTSSSVGHGDSYKTKYEVRLFVMRDGGTLELLDTVEPGYAQQFVFHPSGRFLYVSHSAGPYGSTPSLTVYSIDPQGRLDFVETVQDGGGAMAVTLPPQVRAGTGPTTD